MTENHVEAPLSKRQKKTCFMSVLKCFKCKRFDFIAKTGKNYRDHTRRHLRIPKLNYFSMDAIHKYR